MTAPAEICLEWPQVRPQSTPAAAAKAPTHKKKKKNPLPIPVTNPGLGQLKAAWNTIRSDKGGSSPAGPERALSARDPPLRLPLLLQLERQGLLFGRGHAASTAQKVTIDLPKASPLRLPAASTALVPGHGASAL